MSGFDGLDDEAFPNLRTLESFPDIPKDGYVTVCEVNGELQLAQSTDPENAADSGGLTDLTEHYVPISGLNLKPVQNHRIPSIKTVILNESFLVDTKEQGLKAIWNAWSDAGFNGVLQVLRENGAPQFLITAVQKMLDSFKLITNTKRILKVAIYPHLALSTEDLIELYAPVRDWSKSWVRAMAWHPHFPKLAIALRDDSIRIFVNELSGDVTPFLKAPEQSLISALCWHPYLDELAVGIEAGIVIWNLPTSTRLGQARSEFITAEGHHPVTSVEYSNDGIYLLSSSSADASILIWALSSREHVALHRLSGGGIPRAMWSPNSSSRIFSTTPLGMFRIWTNNKDSNYKPKNWSTAASPVEAFAWHPSAGFVVFSSDFTLYAISFAPPSVEFTKSSLVPQLIPLFDFKECLIPQAQSKALYKIGGRVIQMEWDPTGKRLAVLFADSELLALFRVMPSAETALVPCGFIRGHDGEYPVAIAFQKEFSAGALLSIAWSSERLQYFPFIFNGYGARYSIGYSNKSYTLNSNKISNNGENLNSSNPADAEDSLRFKLFSHEDY